MKENEIMQFLHELGKYVDTPKRFVPNPERIVEVNNANVIAHEMFPDAKISLAHDTLEMGFMILSIVDHYIPVREIEHFQELIGKGNTLEINRLNDEEIELSIVFHDAFFVQAK